MKPGDRTALSDWITGQALPLWSQTGWDAATGTVWEALDHQGQPLRDMPKRLRVQARQAYCFAAAAARAPDLPDLGDQALRLFRFAMTRGIDPETGNLGGLLNPDGSIRTAPHDLYDVAFMLLAASALKCMGGQIYGRLLFRNDDEKARAAKAGITDLDRIYTRDEMVTQDVIFAATGVTGGTLLPGIKRSPGWVETTTLLMRSKTGSVRRMQYRTPV